MSSPSALFPPGSPGVIARVGEHPRKPGRYRVRLVDGRAWTVDADAITPLLPLREGVELEEDAVLRLEAAHRFVAVYDRALGMLARARRTRRELQQRLRRAEPDEAMVARAVEKLETLGLIDDAAVARAEAASRFRRGEGAGRIRQSLMRKGVASSAIDAAIHEVAEEEVVDERALCLAAGEKRVRVLRSLEPDVQRRRLLGFLMRRGFPGYVAGDVVRALVPRGRAAE